MTEDQVEKLGIQAILDAPEKLADESDLQLRQLHHRIFQLAANLRAGQRMSITMADLRAAHKLILEEVGRRGLKGEFKVLKEAPVSVLRAWAPSGGLIATGEASHFIFPQRYKRRLDVPVYLAEHDRILATVKLGEPTAVEPDALEGEMLRHRMDPAVIRARWPSAKRFWMYPVEVVESFKRSMEYVLPDGAASWVEPPIIRNKQLYDADYFRGLTRVDANFVVELAAVLGHAAGDSAMEMGCGTGRALGVLKASGWKASGLDASPAAVEMSEAAGCRVMLADAEDVPMDDDAADTVFSTHVLEHLAEPDRAVRESIRLARKRAIHLVPLGERGDATHIHTYKTLEDLRASVLGMDTGEYAPTFYRLEDTNVALVIFDKERPQLPLVSSLRSFTVVPDFASIAGGAVTKGGEAGDVDVVWRTGESIGKMEVKFRNQLRGTGAEVYDVDHHLNPQGPHGDHIPIYDLVAQLKPEFKMVAITEPRKAVGLTPLRRFTPLKMSAGDTQTGFAYSDKIASWVDRHLKRGASLSVEQKYNGFRAVIQFDGSEPLIYFEDNPKDRSKQFPGVVADLKAIGKPVILDADIGAIYKGGRPVDRVQLGALLGAQVVAEDGSFKTSEDDDATLVVRVFDCLHWKGKGLNDRPWTERRQAAGDALAGADTKLLKLGRAKVVDTAAAVKAESSRVSKAPGSEGAVLKVADSAYPLGGTTPDWAKTKNAVDIKVEVLRRVPVKGAKAAWNYWVAYKGKDGKPVEMGKTFNTSVDASPGDILVLRAEEIIPKKSDAGLSVSAVVPMVAGKSSGEPDGAQAIIRKAAAANVLQAPPALRSEVTKSGDAPIIEAAVVVKQAEGNLDFKEGDTGTGIIQTHERGLSEMQTKLVHDFGWVPVELNEKQLARLSELAGKNVASAFRKAQGGSSGDLGKLVAAIDLKGLSESDRRLIALADPVSVHTDFRLRPGKESYWEGGEGFTPGNQFQANKVRMIAQQGFDGKVLMNFKMPTVPEAGKKPDTHVIRGPLAWMDIGAGKPKVFPPGAVGSSEKAFSRFFIRDRFKWTAGVQDKHYKEFRFDGDQLKGRFIIQYVPTGPGERQWMLSRPGKQEYDSEVLKALVDGDRVVWNAEIMKRDASKRLVTAVVLKPETTDAQGDIMSPEVIEDAAYDFVGRLVQGKAKGIGYLHKDFGRKLLLVASYIAPQPMIIGGKHVPAGSWIMTVKVLDDEVWKRILKGEIRGFSIGGKARVRRL